MTVRAASCSSTTTRVPLSMRSSWSAAYAKQDSLPPRTGIITSPSLPGSMVPVTRRPYRITSGWPTTLPDHFNQPPGYAIERLGLHAGSVEVTAPAAVAALKLLENGDHRPGRSHAEARPPRSLELVLRLGHPGRGHVTQVGSAQRVVGADRLEVDADEPEQERHDEAGSVLAAEAVDDDGSVLWCTGNRGDCLPEQRPAPLEELEVDRAGRGERVGLGVADGVDLGPLGVVRVGQERHVHHLDVDVTRLVQHQLAAEAQVDDPRDAVVEERRPACVAELPDAVGPHDGAEPRRAAVLGRMAAQLPDVDAPVPGEDAVRLQLVRLGPHAASWRARLRCGRRRARPARARRRSSRSCCAACARAGAPRRCGSGPPPGPGPPRRPRACWPSPPRACWARPGR